MEFVDFFTSGSATFSTEMPSLLLNRAWLRIDIQLMYHEVMGHILDLVGSPGKDILVLLEETHCVFLD